MLNQTSPATPADRERDVWIVDVVRTPLDRPGAALNEVQPSALLAGLASQLCRPANSADPLAAVDVFLLGAASRGSVAADTPSSALSRAGFSAVVGVSSVEGSDEAGLDVIRLAAAQLRAGDADIALAGAIHVPSRPREQRRVNPDALGALATQAVSPRAAADVAAALQGVAAQDIARFVEHARQTGAPKDTDGLVAVKDLNGLIILANDASSAGDGAKAADTPSPAHYVLARHAHPQLGQIAAAHTVAMDAPEREGASLVLLARADAARRQGWRPRARIAACAAAGHRRLQSVEALQAAMARALSTARWTADSLDHVTISSRFAGVQLAFARALGLDVDRVDTSPAAWWHANAGAVSGVLALNRLVETLKGAKRKRGALVVCGDGGGVVVVLVERGHDD